MDLEYEILGLNPSLIRNISPCLTLSSETLGKLLKLSFLHFFVK